jgi:hypothetical protein
MGDSTFSASVLPWDGGNDYTSASRYDTTEAVLSKIEPLQRHLGELDAARMRLEQEGGTLQEVSELIMLLEKELSLTIDGRTHRVSLVDVKGLRDLFTGLSYHGLHLEVRAHASNGMPLYYLCRLKRDYLSEYSLILEDLHVSAGYPMPDPRLVRLMGLSGRQQFYVRLSPFRGGAIKRVSEHVGDTTRTQADEILRRLGEVFQSAWHEDQLVAYLVAREFGVPALLQATELLYLSLGADLCALRDEADVELEWFFEEAYPQPAIAGLLRSLDRLDGQDLDRIPRLARDLYVRLATRFQAFLETEVQWPPAGRHMPIYKLILANVSRLHRVAQELTNDPVVTGAAKSLEADAAEIARELLAQVDKDRPGERPAQPDGPA